MIFDMQYIKTEKLTQDGIGVIYLNRPEALNALNTELMEELSNQIVEWDNDNEIKCIVLTGSEKVFAAGADIKQMAGKGAIDMLIIDQFTKWDKIKRCKKPLVAGVSGFALGGGCELVMHCDMIVASETAQFGQPEIKIGVMPGAGGTQRLTRAIGKARAMEMVLTGKFITADEALNYGLINKVVPVEIYLQETLKLAKQVASMPPVAVRLAKEAVLKSFETSLEEGLIFERKNFYLLFASDDQKEGMNAFIEKRQPNWKAK
jgi:enoyl-CoA hydratase